MLTVEQKHLRGRILDITHEARVGHLGSALSVVDIISAVYRAKKPNERFVLSAGHSAAALYAVLEERGFLRNPKIEELGVHPERNEKNGIDVSTGSLGQGLPIALGMAMTDRSKNVWCVSTDGEMAEGSMWESMRIAADHKITNLKLIVNANGYAAYDSVSPVDLRDKIKGFGWETVMIDGHDPKTLDKALELKSFRPIAVIAKTTSEQFPFLKGLDAHYHVMTNEEYAQARLELR